MSAISPRPVGPDPATLVSVVVAARNAAATIGQTLESLRGQTWRPWEAVVVDDGSTDETARLVAAAGASDARIRLVPRGGGGVGASRTVGVAEARGAMLLFLDADDWLLPSALERLAAPLLDDPVAGGAYCGWMRVGADGETISEWRPASEPELFPAFARFCPFAVHCCLIRRSVFDELGGFDLTLRTCEDWDLWQRLTRIGTPLVAVHETLAVYRTRPGSISLTHDGYVADGLEVVRRGHSPDPRVRNPLPAYRNGAPRSLATPASRQLVLWGAGLAIGGGRDAGREFELAAEHLDLTFPPGLAAETLYWAVPVGAAQPCARWPELFPACVDHLNGALAELERRTRAPLLATRARRVLERRIAYAADSDCRVGGTERLSVELTRPLVDVVSQCERIVFAATAEGEPLGLLELPACDGRVPARILADAASDAFGWRLLGRYLERRGAAESQSRWHAFLRELWDRPDWPLEHFYRSGNTASDPGERRLPPIELSTRLQPLAVTGPTEVPLLLAGSFIGNVCLTGDGDISVDELIAAVTAIVGYDLCIAAVRDAVVGRSLDDATPLRERLAQVANDGVPGRKDGELAVMRRRPDLFGTAASRLAALPAGTDSDVRRAARRMGERLNGPRRPDAILYRPDLVPRHSPPHELSNDDGAEAGEHDTVPILMYHRVTDDEAGLPSRFRVRPDTFSRQLRHLREEGYESITWLRWLRARAEGRPLAERAVILTFDDGYIDFATHAWPLLRRHGFGATLFVVADALGGSNTWDTAFGPPLRLLGSKDLRRLQLEGLVVGAHSATHPPLTGLSHEQVVSESLRARSVLHRRLGTVPDAFAYPYGDVDPSVASLVGACGYTFGLTCRPASASFDDGLLDLPRIEIDGDQSLDWFHESLRAGRSAAQI